ncbi:DUF982 domain-containing protein [Mesorhizobium sp. M0340]
MKWTKRGPGWDLAVRVCMAVIFDEMETEEARKAFLAAAKEEGTLLPQWQLARKAVEIWEGRCGRALPRWVRPRLCKW